MLHLYNNTDSTLSLSFIDLYLSLGVKFAGILVLAIIQWSKKRPIKITDR